MSAQTSNYKLEKPSPEEFYDVAVPNANMDKIDAALKTLSDGLRGIDLTKLSQSITASDNKVKAHLEDMMPHRFVDNGKNYRWGFRTVNGEPEFIFEELE